MCEKMMIQSVVTG